MGEKHIHILNNFNLKNIPDLDVAVLGALELFQQVSLPEIDFKSAKHPLIVGSGNAEVAGRIIFRDTDAVFASESSCEEKLKKISSIDRVILISAFAGKHAPAMADLAKKYGKPVTLFTNNPNSETRKKLDPQRGDEEYVFPKNREPYTYNTSTYMGMFLSSTGENPKEIYDFIHKEIIPLDFSRVAGYDRFFLIVPNQFSEVQRLFSIKFMELFGRRIARDIATFDFMGHATTVVPSGELFLSFGGENNIWGVSERRIHIPLPQEAGYAAMMAVGYYVIGEIQKRREPYFKEYLASYVEESSRLFGHDLGTIVE